MALHQGGMGMRVGRPAGSTLVALERANAVTRSGPSEFWTGRLERAAAARSRRGTTFSDVAHFAVDNGPVTVVDFVVAEEDTSGW